MRIPYGPDENQFGELTLPRGSGPFPLLIAIHGGFWRARYDLSHMEPLCAYFAALGIAAWNIEYRRIGQPGGGWPGTCEDVVTGVRHAKALASKHPIDVSRRVAVGYSAGGHLALYAASQEPGLRGVASLAGVADLQIAWDLRLSDGVVQEFLNGLPEQFPEASPSNLAISVRQRLVQGDQDESVPIEIARAYCRVKRSRGEDVVLVELAGVNHSDLVEPRSAAWPAVERTILDLAEAQQGNRA